MKLSGILGLRPSAKTILTSAAALGALAFTAQANAADIYAPAPGGFKDIPPVIVPAPTWTGFYAGVNMGAAWSELNTAQNHWIWDSTASCATSACFGGQKLDSTTAFGGGQLGYNWQGWGNFVFGVEVDLLGVGGNNTRTFVGKADGRLTGADTLVVNTKVDGGFAGDVTGRLGYAWGNWLLYAKGGWAWFNPDLSASAVALSAGLPVGSVSGWDNSQTLTGWTIGGGMEWMLNPNWSVKLEYQYYDYNLDNKNWAFSYTTPGGSTVTHSRWNLFDDDLTVSTVKLGVNYHLNSGGYVPIK